MFAEDTPVVGRFERIWTALSVSNKRQEVS